MNEIMGKELKKETNIEFVYDSGKNELADPLAISNAINECSNTKGKNLSDNIQTTSTSRFTLPPINEKTMYLGPANRSEILKLV